MARKAVIEREGKRQRLVEKYSARVKEIKNGLSENYAALSKPGADYDKIYDQIEVLQERLESEIPRNATRKRLRNRCALTGRSRGVYRDFQLSRSMLRKYAMMGLVPGIRKASW